jgi:hypothetical protein
MRGRWTTTGGGRRGLGRCRKVTTDGGDDEEEDR